MAELIRKPDGTYVRESSDKGEEESGHWAYAKDPTPLLWATVKSLRTKQSYKRRADDLALHLYSDMRYVGYRSTSATAHLEDVIGARLGENVIRAITRALNSKLARRRSRPYVVTNDGSWSQRNAAENLEKWLLGKLREQRSDEELLPLFRLQALTFGTGCIRVSSDDAQGVFAEVIPSPEIVIDDSEGRYGKPACLYFIRTASRARLMAKYPKREEVIKQMHVGPHVDKEWSLSVGDWDKENNSDVGPILEAYYLPSGPDTNDGRHVIAVTSGWILDEPWERDHFPCAWMRGELRPMGFWGIGVPEDLAGVQIEISATALARQNMVEMLATPYWLVERGMKMVKSHISNLIGRVMEYTATGSGTRPELVAPQAVPPDVWQHGASLKQTAFESKGVSQLAAQMLKPAGLNSGKALRAFNEMEAELLSDLMNNYEDGLLQLCKLLIEEQIELGSKGKKHSVTYVGRGTIEKIEWNDEEFKDALENYVLEILPASALASTFSARLEDVYDMRDLGLLTDPGEIEDYLDMPDKRRAKRKTMSDAQLLDRVIEQRIIKDGEDVHPKPTWNLKLARRKALMAINELELYEDAPLDRLELLRKFIQKCILVENIGAPNLGIPPTGIPLDNGINSDPAALAGSPDELALAGGLPADPGLAGGLPPGDPGLEAGIPSGSIPAPIPGAGGPI